MAIGEIQQFGGVAPTDPNRLYNMAWNVGAEPGTGAGLSFADFMAATPAEREAYFRMDPRGALTNIVGVNSPEQLQAAVAGIDPALAQQVLGQYQGVQTARSQAAADRDFSDVMHSRLGPFIGLGALGGAAYLGLGAGTAAEAAAGGATAAAPEALGSGVSLGAGGASGITPGVTAGGIGGGALGTGLTVPAAAAGGGAAPAAVGAGALGAGYFAGESLYPVIGGLSGSASGGATALGGAAGGAASAGGTAGAAAGGTALSRILAGNGTADDYLSVAGAVGPAALGAYGSYQQTQAYRDLADKYAAMGAPYRSRLEALYNDPTSYLTSSEVQVPVQQGTDALARSLSAKVGNPIGNPTALQEIQNYSANQLYGRLGAEKDRLAGFGGLTQYNAAAPGAAAAEVGSQRGIYDAIGAGAADLFNPRPKPLTLNDIYRAYRGGTGSLA